MVPVHKRCICNSFVNPRYRCDRQAEANGRCKKHNDPMHLNKTVWQRKDLTMSHNDVVREIRNRLCAAVNERNGSMVTITKADACAIGDALDRLQAQEQGAVAWKYCWLVELFLPEGNSMGYYHTGFTGLDGFSSRTTQDANEARKYETKEDAEKVAAKLAHLQGVWRAIEHGFMAEHPAPSVVADEAKPKTVNFGLGVQLIAAERGRQISEEGWTPEHDAEHDLDQLATAAAMYALTPATREMEYVYAGGGRWKVPKYWPWDWRWWKPGPTRIRDLEKAGALIAAEIDRLAALQVQP
jgi:hypothetical protein